ncbi:MAG TPA: hypothetical protein VFW39_11880 [Sphingomicrobium sp.]|nr:hypothetical protein [Sphingomicrobium sp.]
MKRYILMAGVATAMAIAPSAAFASGDGTYTSISFDNHIGTALFNASVEFEGTALIGDVTLTGVISPNSAAIANTDTKQILSGESVTFSKPDNNKKNKSDPATVHNNATANAVTGEGNVGVNVAAGQDNMQQNSANMAVSADTNAGANGWASASTTAYQSLTGTSYGVSGNNGNGEGNGNGNKTHYQDRNNATGHAVSGDGNVGVNVAAGAFNQQQNLLTLAVANNSVLAQSNAALFQTASCNTVDIQDQRNNATSGVINGSGNFGVNIAAGVGNQQINSLTAAVSGPLGG